MTARDVWYTVLVKQTSENDGWTYRNRGAEAAETLMTLQEVKALSRDERQKVKRILEQALEGLSE